MGHHTNAAPHARDAVAWTPETGYVFAPDKKAAPVAAPPPEFGVGGYPVTAPPSREWQSLTDEEIEHTINNIRTCEWQGAFNQALARAIEAALRTKNTGEQA